MLDNLLKKNPVLGVIIYPLLGLGAIGLVTITHRAFRYWKKRVVRSRLILLFTLPIN